MEGADRVGAPRGREEGRGAGDGGWKRRGKGKGGGGGGGLIFVGDSSLRRIFHLIHTVKSHFYALTPCLR